MSNALAISLYETFTCFGFPVNKSRPCTEIANDPYAERELIVKTANNLAKNLPVRWNIHKNSSLQNIFQKRDGSFSVSVGTAQENKEIIVDQIVSLTGYRPDLAILEELQCEISVKKLASNEKNFFIIGHKSHNRDGNFLIQSGFKQLEYIFNSLI